MFIKVTHTVLTLQLQTNIRQYHPEYLKKIYGCPWNALIAIRTGSILTGMQKVLLVGDSTLREDSAGLLVSFKLMKFLSRSAEETQIIGFSLGKLLKSQGVVCLYGELGAGKTTFVKGIAQALEFLRVMSRAQVLQ